MLQNPVLIVFFLLSLRQRYFLEWANTIRCNPWRTLVSTFMQPLMLRWVSRRDSHLSLDSQKKEAKRVLQHSWVPELAYKITYDYEMTIPYPLVCQKLCDCSLRGQSPHQIPCDEEDLQLLQVLLLFHIQPRKGLLMRLIHPLLFHILGHPSSPFNLFINRYGLGNVTILESIIPFLYPSLNPYIIIEGEVEMKKKRIDLEEEKKTGVAFLEKLSTFKKASKEIKQKNRLTVHKIEWAKEYKYLGKLERNMEKETYDMLEGLDVRFLKEFEEYQVFGKDQEKSYVEIYEMHRKKVETNSANISYQVDSLREVLRKLKESPEFYEGEEVKSIIGSIGSFFDQLERMIEEEGEAIQIGDYEGEDDEKMAETLFSQEKMLLGNQVKGFDVKKERILKMTNNENILREFLEGTGLDIEKHEESQLIEEFSKAMRFLEERYQLEFVKLDMDYEDALTMDQSILQSDNYLKLNHIYNSYIGRGKDRNMYSERLSIEFPNISRNNLDILTGYIEAKMYKGKKRKALWRNFYKEKSDLIDKAEQQVIRTIENKMEEGKAETEKLQRKEEQLRLGEKLALLKKQFKRKKEQEEKERVEEERRKKEEQEKEERLWKQHAEEVGKKAESYKKEAEEKRKQSEIVRKQQEKLDREVNQKKILENKPKVQMRQSIERRKISDKLEKKQEAIEEKIIKEEKLENAIRNYSHRPNVEADFQRLKAPTTSLLSKKVEYDKADKVDLVKVHGYNVGQLMSDMRYRLNLAFQDAGLSGAAYAREVINQMSKPKEM